MTIGVEFESKIVTVDGVPIRISLYDAVSVLSAAAAASDPSAVALSRAWLVANCVPCVLTAVCRAQPGNHRFRKLSMPYYRSLACVIVVYDVTRCAGSGSAALWLISATCCCLLSHAAFSRSAAMPPQA